MRGQDGRVRDQKDNSSHGDLVANLVEELIRKVRTKAMMKYCLLLLPLRQSHCFWYRLRCCAEGCSVWRTDVSTGQEQTVQIRSCSMGDGFPTPDKTPSTARTGH